MRIGHDRHGTQEAIGLSLVSWRITVNSVSFELNLRGSRCWCCKLMRRGVTQQVIWAALFALAVLVREGSTPHSRLSAPLRPAGCSHPERLHERLQGAAPYCQRGIVTACGAQGLSWRRRKTAEKSSIVSAHYSLQMRTLHLGQPFSMQSKDYEHLRRSMRSVTACLKS